MLAETVMDDTCHSIGFASLRQAQEELSRKKSELQELDNNSSNYSMHDYLCKVSELDREIMLLESFIDSEDRNWKPVGSKFEDFSIGTNFRNKTGRWICTDIGENSISALRATPRVPQSNYEGTYRFNTNDFSELEILE